MQEREYERLGETVTRSADVRIVAASNRDLKKRVAEGSFREDLYYRLNVITVAMPPLRARAADLLRFSQHYLEHFSSQCGRPLASLTDEAIGVLQSHSWPGNLRELRNTIERAVILAKDTRIAAADLPIDLRIEGSPPSAAGEDTGQAGAMISLEDLESLHIRRVLGQTASMTQAAEILGIDQATLYRKRKKLRLE